MLSMDPFPAMAGTGGAAAGRRGVEGGGIRHALRGPLSMPAMAAMHPRDALSQMANLDVRELELTSVAGEPSFIATLGGGDTRILTPGGGRPQTEFDRRRIIATVKAAEPAGLADVRELDRYDRYYLDRRRHLPLPVILARLNDADETRYYIDPKTARIVGTYSSRNRFSRWLYHGLHSLDFPWLYNYRPLWDIVVILFMVGGTALGVTSPVLAWRVVRRSLSGAVHLDGLSAGPLSGTHPGSSSAGRR